MSEIESQPGNRISLIKFVVPIACVTALLVLLNLSSDATTQGRQTLPGGMPVLKKAEQAFGPLIERGGRTAEKVVPLVTRPIEIGFDYIDKAADAISQQTKTIEDGFTRCHLINRSSSTTTRSDWNLVEAR